jgi:hypothetical protein
MGSAARTVCSQPDAHISSISDGSGHDRCSDSDWFKQRFGDREAS